MKKKGFTLLEAIVVMAIFGIVMAMIVPIATSRMSVNGVSNPNYKITHRHNDGTTTVYLTYQRPYKFDGDAGVRVHTVEGKTVMLSGDIVIEETN